MEQNSKQLNRKEAAGNKRKNSTGLNVGTNRDITGVAIPMVPGVKMRRNSIGSASGTVKPAHRQQKDITVKGKQQEYTSLK